MIYYQKFGVRIPVHREGGKDGAKRKKHLVNVLLELLF